MKWRPSKAQKSEFAKNMQNQEYADAYYKRQKEREDKRRATSQFDYKSAGGKYVATREQHDWTMNNMHMFTTQEEQDAANMVLYSFSCNEKYTMILFM